MTIRGVRQPFPPGTVAANLGSGAAAPSPVSLQALARAISIQPNGGGTPTGTTQVYGETPGGTIDGSNKVFTLAHSPTPANSSKGWVRQGGVGTFLPAIYGVDFTLSGVTITMTTAPIGSSNLLFDYVY